MEKSAIATEGKSPADSLTKSVSLHGMAPVRQQRYGALASTPTRLVRQKNVSFSNRTSLKDQVCFNLAIFLI